MNARAASADYNVWHARYDIDDGRTSPWHQLIFRYLDPRRDLADKIVLEVACGRGGLACRLAAESSPPATVVAADFSSTALAKGRCFALQEHLPNVLWEASDIQALAHSDGQFDTVISCETIEHLPHPRLAIAEMARVLKPGGRLFLTTPNYIGPLGLYRLYLRFLGRRYTEQGQPINRLTMLPLSIWWLQRARLRIIAVDATGHYIPVPKRVPIAIQRLERSWLRWFALHSLLVAEKVTVTE
jgi:2-polyprenyl-3-methyl-5-hydroxy-6-metoxy-1,4-benzoquinol methylase